MYEIWLFENGEEDFIGSFVSYEKARKFVDELKATSSGTFKIKNVDGEWVD